MKPFGIVESESTSVTSSTSAQVTAEKTKAAVTAFNDISEVSVQNRSTTTAEKHTLNTSTVVSDKKTEIIQQQTTGVSENIKVSVTTVQINDVNEQEASAIETEPVIESDSEITGGYANTGNNRPNVIIMGSLIVFPNYKIPTLIHDVGLTLLDAIDCSVLKNTLIHEKIYLNGSCEWMIKNIAQRWYDKDASSAFVRNNALFKDISHIVKSRNIEGWYTMF